MPDMKGFIYCFLQAFTCTISSNRHIDLLLQGKSGHRFGGRGNILISAIFLISDSLCLFSPPSESCVLSILFTCLFSHPQFYVLSVTTHLTVSLCVWASAYGFEVVIVEKIRFTPGQFSTCFYVYLFIIY